MKPDKVIETHDELGEGISWRASDQTLWWTDILGKRLNCLDWLADELRAFDVPERLTCFGFVNGDDERLVCGFESGFAFFLPESGDIEWIARPLADRPGVRMNDGRVDRQGRLWVGSMVENEAVAPAANAGALYRLDSNLQVTQVLDGLHISNGLGWSPASDAMYLADSPLHEVRRYEFDAATGQPGASREFARFADDEYPDGATVDADGNLWQAIWAGSRVDCIAPGGATLRSLEVPVSQPTCTCFAGADLSSLAVSTAWTGLTDEQRAAEPLAGCVLIYNDAGAGIAEPLFKPGV